MPQIRDLNGEESTSVFSVTGGVIILLVTATVVVLGAVCKYLRKLCQKVWKDRWKRGSKRRKSKRYEQSKAASSVKRTDSKSSKSREKAGIAPQFSIPKTRTNVMQQPWPELSQCRTGKSDSQKRLTLVSLYFNEGSMGELNPDLYQTHEAALRMGVDHNLGQLNLIIKYNNKSRSLIINLVSGKDFPPRDYSGSIDTCVTICVLPNRERRKQTAIHRRSTNPTYNESFTFNIQAGEDVHSHSLFLITFLYDQFSHAHVLGECLVPLIDFDLSGDTVVWCYLEESSASVTSLVGAIQSIAHAPVGDLLLSLCYTTRDQTLAVAIMKGMNFSQGPLSTAEKLYTKATLLLDGQKLGKRKTSLQEIGSLYTVFNEALFFRVTVETLENCTLKVSVNHYNVVGKSSTLGEVNFSEESTGLELAHWLSITARHDKPVSMWHTLRGFKLIETGRDDREPLSPQ